MATPVRRGAPRRRASAKSASSEKENPTGLEVADVDIRVEDLATSQQTINVLLAGPSGHGKTVLASFAPRCTIISTETGGPISAKRAGSRARAITALDWEHVVAAKKWCDEHLKAGDWVVLDSLTKMQVLMVRWILRLRHSENSSRDLDIPAIQDHQKWQNYFKRFVDQFIDAPYNVVFICGDMIRTDHDGEDIVLPHIEGKDYAICNYVRAQTSLNIYYAVTDKLSPEEEPEDGSPVRRALFQPFPPFVFPKDRFILFGRYRNVYAGEYAIMADWIAEIEQALASGLQPDAEEAGSEVTPATPIRRRRTARA